MGDPWEEGFGGDDDWEGKESLEADLEDDMELGLGELDQLEDDDPDELDDDDPE